MHCTWLYYLQRTRLSEFCVLSNDPLSVLQVLVLRLLQAVICSLHWWLCCWYLSYFLQCSCCCLYSEGSNGNLPLNFFPGFMLIGFVFNVKHGIVDPWEWFSCVLVMAAWSEDNMSVGKLRGKKKNRTQ